MHAQRKTNTDSNNATWTGMVPVDDTALAVTDTGGPGIPVVYLNGHMASQREWRRVIAELGTGWRHITYDMRARGKSKFSADYSFETNVRDVDAVLAARGVKQALVVGWSYGAFVAAHWASCNPDRTVGAVLVEGAQPNDWIDEIDIEGMRKLWRRLSCLFVLLRWTAWWTGMVPRMTAEQMANSNIELGMIARARTGPRAGQHHRPDPVCERFGVGAGKGTRTRQPRAGGRKQPEHQDLREGPQQARQHPAQGLPRRRRSHTRGRRPQRFGSRFVKGYCYLVMLRSVVLPKEHRDDVSGATLALYASAVRTSTIVKILVVALRK